MVQQPGALTCSITYICVSHRGLRYERTFVQIGPKTPAAAKIQGRAAVITPDWLNTTIRISSQSQLTALQEEEEEENTPKHFRNVRLTGWQGDIACVNDPDILRRYRIGQASEQLTTQGCTQFLLRYTSCLTLDMVDFALANNLFFQGNGRCISFPNAFTLRETETRRQGSSS